MILTAQDAPARVMASSCTKGGSGWILGEISSQKSGEALAWAAQGGGADKNHGDVTEGHGQ